MEIRSLRTVESPQTPKTATRPAADATLRWLSTEMMIFNPELRPGPGGSPCFQPVNSAPEESKGITFGEMKSLGLRHALG